MIISLRDFQNPFFIGIAGTGMSALAQYLKGMGKNVSGSDRYFTGGEYNETKARLEAEGINCFLQDGSGITSKTDLVIASTAIEDRVADMQQAKMLSIPVIRRSELLSMIAASKKTIAIGGTSGKSTTAAMIFEILEYAGMKPGIISGAGLTRIIKEGKIGNARVGEGDWLVIEADESDGSIVQYQPEIGVLLNIDKDHKEIDELMNIFTIFRDNSRNFIVNQSHPLARSLSRDITKDFSADESIKAGFIGSGFSQAGLKIRFQINDVAFELNTVGMHNMENALAAAAVAAATGIALKISAEALVSYEGIYRRHQVLGNKNGVWIIDDYAHNPAKCAASIRACQPVAKKVIAWFQPHGYAPTKFLRTEFAREIADALRPGDEIWMSEIFYAGGTAIKDISANDLIHDLKAMGKKAFFVADRNDFVNTVRPHLDGDCVLLLMGARDPSLEQYSASVFAAL